MTVRCGHTPPQHNSCNCHDTHNTSFWPDAWCSYQRCPGGCMCGGRSERCTGGAQRTWTGLTAAGAREILTRVIQDPIVTIRNRSYRSLGEVVPGRERLSSLACGVSVALADISGDFFHTTSAHRLAAPWSCVDLNPRDSQYRRPSAVRQFQGHSGFSCLCQVLPVINERKERGPLLAPHGMTVNAGFAL